MFISKISIHLTVILLFSLSLISCGGGSESAQTELEPPQNSAPKISGPESFELLRRQNFKFIPEISDADGDSLSFSIENKPSWLEFNESSGELFGLPNEIGTFDDIKIIVSDDYSSSQLKLSIEVIESVVISGKVISSNNSESLVFIDLNNNDKFEENEPNSSTDDLGYYQLFVNSLHIEKLKRSFIQVILMDKEESNSLILSALPLTHIDKNTQEITDVVISPFTHLVNQRLLWGLKQQSLDDISLGDIDTIISSISQGIVLELNVLDIHIKGDYSRELSQLTAEQQSLLMRISSKMLIDFQSIQRMDLDTDKDGIVNGLDEDVDGDFIVNVYDDFPVNNSQYRDSDNDFIADNIDRDDDNDGILDSEDFFPLDPNLNVLIDLDNDGWPKEQDPDDQNFEIPSIAFIDTDGDGFADSGGLNDDLDNDNDGIINIRDEFPTDFTESQDFDNDGLGNNQDFDDDGDLVADTIDDFPLDHSESVDDDQDGLGNNIDLDDNSNGILDENEPRNALISDLQFTNKTENTGLSHLWQASKLENQTALYYENVLFGSSGALIAGDYDSDGDIDIFVAGGDYSASKLFQNQGDNSYINVAKSAGVELSDELLSGASFVDTDNDGDLDLFVGGLEGNNYLFINKANGTFAAPILIAMESTTTVSSAFGDYDKDGDLDMLISHWTRINERKDNGENLWQNQGNNKFISVNIESNVESTINSTPGSPDYSFSPAFADINNDQYPDILMASDFNQTVALINNSDATFTDYSRELNIKVPDLNGMGSAIGDIDNDGDLDWFVSGIFSTTNTGNKLFENDGQATFNDVSFASGIYNSGWSWGSCFADFNNDSYLDLFVTNGFYLDDADGVGTEPFTSDSVKLFLSDRKGGFKESAVAANLTDNGQGRGVMCYDANNDGNVDIFILNLDSDKNSILYYENSTKQWIGNYLAVSLRSHFQNKYAIGARVKVTSGGITQMREISINSNFISHNPTQANFGLGENEIIDKIEVTWPDGQTTMLTEVNINQAIIIEQK